MVFSLLLARNSSSGSSNSARSGRDLLAILILRALNWLPENDRDDDAPPALVPPRGWNPICSRTDHLMPPSWRHEFHSRPTRRLTGGGGGGGWLIDFLSGLLHLPAPVWGRPAREPQVSHAGHSPGRPATMIARAAMI